MILALRNFFHGHQRQNGWTSRKDKKQDQWWFRWTSIKIEYLRYFILITTSRIQNQNKEKKYQQQKEEGEEGGKLICKKFIKIWQNTTDTLFLEPKDMKNI